CAVLRIGGVAVADVTEFNEFRRITHGAGRIAEQDFLLLGWHQLEQFTRLFEVVVVILMIRPVLGVAAEAQWWFLELGLGLPLAEAIGLVVQLAAIVAICSTSAITMVAVYRAARLIDRNLVQV